MVLFSLEFFSKKIPFSTFSHTSQEIHSYIHLCIFWSKNPLKNLIKAMDLIFRKAINIHIFSQNSGILETLGPTPGHELYFSILSYHGPHRKCLTHWDKWKRLLKNGQGSAAAGPAWSADSWRITISLFITYSQHIPGTTNWEVLC